MANCKSSFLALLIALSLPVFGVGLQVKDTVLANGLKVVVYENHAAPVTATEVWYRVGSYYEQSGYTGMSHLLEHMMFKGTKHYPGGKYSELIEAQGGRENAFTSEHYTVYWAELASDRYELEMKLEADKMAYLLLDSSEFEKERNVVMEERRLGENDPSDALWESFYAAAYQTHPYHNPVVGWMDDLARLRRSDLWRHYQRFYSPSNAVLVVAGDVSAPKVFAQAAQYYGRIKSHPVEHWHPVEPEQRGERTVVVKRDVQMPALMMGWHVPGSSDSDYYAFEVLQGLLMRGFTSRLTNKLVYSGQKALYVWGGNDAQTDPGIFYVFTAPRSPALVDTVIGMVAAEMESLKTKAVSDSELTKVKNQVIADFVFGQDDNSGLAYQIAHSYTMYGSIDYANEYPNRIAAVTAQDIMRAVKKYMTDDNLTVGRLLPGKTAGEEK